MAANVTPGLGLSLIDILVKQLEGEATWNRDRRGTTLTLGFPVRVA